MFFVSLVQKLQLYLQLEEENGGPIMHLGFPYCKFICNIYQKQLDMFVYCQFFLLATLAQRVVHPFVVGKVIGSNLGPTPRHN